MTAESDLDNPAWTFCLDLYRREGVPVELVDLQDRRGVDVSLLLVCLWLGAERGVVLGDEEIAAADAWVAQWRDTAVRPLRAVRRGLKPLSADRPEIAAFRSRVQAIEIEAERLEIAMLHAWSAALPAGKAGSAAAASANLRRVTGGDAPPALAAALSGRQDTMG